MALIQTTIPSPNGTLATTGALIPINQEEIVLAHHYAQNDFLKPYIDATVSAALKDGLEIHITRDSAKNKKPAAKPAAAAPQPFQKSKPAPPEPPKNPDREEEPSVSEKLERSKAGESPPKSRPPGAPKFPEPETTGREEIELPPEEVKHIREKWSARCRDLLTEALITGIVPITIYSEAGKGKLVSFAVQDFQNRLLFMRRNSLRPVPEWFVEYLDRKAGKIRIDAEGNVDRGGVATSLSLATKPTAAGPGAPVGTAEKPTLMYDPTVTVQDNENNVGVETMEGGRTHLIYVLYPPTPDGHLTSPVMRSIRACTALTVVRFTEQYTAKNRATPLHVIGTGAAGRGGASGGGTTGRETLIEGRFANNDVVVSEDQATFRLFDRDLRAYEAARQIAQATNGSVSAEAARRIAEQTGVNTAGGVYTHRPLNPAARTVEEIAMATPPYQANSLVLPNGQQMFPGPQSESLATLGPYIEWQKEELSATWEIPPQVLNPQGSKYASDEQLVMRKWEEKLQWYLAHMSQFVSEIYSAAHYKGGRRFAKIIAKSLKDEEDMQEYAGEKFGVELEKEKAKFEIPEIAAADQLLTDRKRKKMREKIRSSIRVEATFHHSYTVDPAIAQTLHGLNGIDDNTLISVLGSAAGIPRNRLLLTQAERDEQKSKRDAEQRDSMLATMPPPDAAGPPMKKPAAKPAGGKFGKDK